MDYAERLSVPLRWWAQGTMLVASLWLAVIVAIPGPAAWAVTVAALVLLVLALLSYGAPKITVSGRELRAGRARIDVSFVGSVTPLDAAAMRRQAGVDADARAYLLLRPYLRRGVRVDIVDPHDPVPYWLIGSRRPEELTRVLQRVAG